MAQNSAPIQRDAFVNDLVSELEQEDRDRIVGYEDQPIMSLENAVKSIIPHVPDVLKYVKEAEGHPIESTELTADEGAAIYLYTMQNGFHKKLNRALRARESDALIPWLGYLKLFLNAVEKLPSCRTTIWRGIRTKFDAEFAEDSFHT
jgi:hypothetical protein